MNAAPVARFRNSLATAIGLRLASVMALIIAVQIAGCIYENLCDEAYYVIGRAHV